MPCCTTRVSDVRLAAVDCLLIWSCSNLGHAAQGTQLLTACLLTACLCLTVCLNSLPIGIQAWADTVRCRR